MPADRSTTGTGSRRQGQSEPEQPDSSSRNIARALNRDQEGEAAADAYEAGRQPGAHGRQSPHRNVKPGTELTLEEANRRVPDDAAD